MNRSEFTANLQLANQTTPTTAAQLTGIAAERARWAAVLTPKTNK